MAGLSWMNMWALTVNQLQEQPVPDREVKMKRSRKTILHNIPNPHWSGQSMSHLGCAGMCEKRGKKF
jgi:hypothetical protein